MDIFITKIHRANNKKLADELYLPCKQVLKDCDFHDTYKNGKTTFFNNKILENNEDFGKLYKYISSQIFLYISDLDVDKKDLELNIKGSWVSEMYQNGDHGMHVHTNESLLSGNFYIHTPENSGKLVFSRHEWMSDPFCLLRFNNPNSSNSIEWSFTPKKGDLYIWKSDLPHRVETNKNYSRIAISFNVGFNG